MPEKLNRSRSVSAQTDQLTQDGTTIRSPLPTACAASSRWNVPLPSKTWYTVEPTSRRARVSAPARRRWNSVRIVGITSPPVVGLV